MAGFYKAALEFDFPAFRGSGAESLETTWAFRPVDDRWLISEPIEAELGDRQLRQSAHFGLRYREWDAEVIDRIALAAEAARQADLTRPGFEPPREPLFIVEPTVSADPLLAPGAESGAYSVNTVRIWSPDSYAFGLHRPGASQDELVGAIQHECGRHLVHTRLRGRQAG